MVTLVALACLATIYLTPPLPPPKVALVIGPAWRSDGTNTFIAAGLNNFGTTRVIFADQTWQVIAETPSGWVTNRAPLESLVRVPPGEVQGFTVYLPIDTTRWQIAVRYHYHHLHYSPDDASDLIGKTGFWELAPEFASSAARWCLDFFWLKTEGDDVLATRFFTNLPPVQPWPPK